MRVLVACEFSGRVRDNFLKRGHDAWSCDIEPSWVRREKHIRGDVRPLLREKWDLVIAHPPCTYLCNSGRRWLVGPKRLKQMVDGVEFFRECLNANAERVCVENPIPMSEAVKLLGEKYTQIVHPWWFGEAEKKSVCLWLRNLPKLVPTNVVKPVLASVHRMAPGKSRSQLRSITFWGIAEAMATQWG